MNLQGKKILITGASRGLGKELALLLDWKSCSFYLVARSIPDLNSLKNTLKNPAKVFPCDLSDSAQRRKLIADVIDSTKRLDVIINCAGIGSHSWLSQMTVDEVERVMQLNALAPLELIAGLRPLLPADGLIVNIGSAAGEMRLPSIGLYAASKAALHTFTYSVAFEGVQTLLVILGALRGTNFAQSITHPRTEQPNWYRRLDVSVELAGKKIVRAMEQGHNRIILPRWYPVVIVLSRFFAPVIKSLPYSGGRHV